MDNELKKNWFLYALAILIPLIFFTHLNWNSENPVWQHRDIYFGADSNRIINDLKDGHLYTNISDNAEHLISHTRDNLHPYFSLFAVTISNTGKAMGFENTEFPIYRTVFGSLGVFLFWLFIYKQTNALQAFSSLILLMSTMTFRIWTAVPDTFIFSFAALMLSINLIRVSAKPEYVLLASMTGALSNITLGLFNLLLKYKNIKDTIKIIIMFITLGLMLSVIQQIIYPTSSHFFDYGIVYEAAYIKTQLSPSFLLFKVFDFFVSGFLLPLSSSVNMPVSTDGLWLKFLSADHSKRFLLQTAITIALLSSLYISAILAFRNVAKVDKVGLNIMLYIGFELIFHMFYGDPPFLYSLNFLPMIIIFLSLYQTDKIKKLGPILFLLMSISIQKFSVLEFGLFDKYFL